MATHRYKKLGEQTIVITGASSGIGLATAKRAARAGARLVLASRNEEILRQVCDEVAELGGKAVHAVADVGEEEQVRHIAEVAEREFGGFDTWVNNAGVVVFSELMDMPNTDHERLFQTNYWGMVYGSQVAVRHFRDRPDGGTLINVASINAEMPVPILGAYSASKSAVRAFTDVLRMELEHEDAPVAITLIKPSGISTPISDHGRTHMGEGGKVMPPLYDVELVAKTILTAAQRRVRAVTVGETGKASTLAWHTAPSIMDRVIGWALPKAQSTGKPPRPTDNLYTAGKDGQVYLNGKRQGIRVSPFTQARLYPAVTVGVGALAAAGLVAYMALRRR